MLSEVAEEVIIIDEIIEEPIEEVLSIEPVIELELDDIEAYFEENIGDFDEDILLEDY
jgi:hypothetical protein